MIIRDLLLSYTLALLSEGFLEGCGTISTCEAKSFQNWKFTALNVSRCIFVPASHRVFKLCEIKQFQTRNWFYEKYHLRKWCNSQQTTTCSKSKIQTREKWCEICSKLTMKILERRQWRRSSIFTINFENILDIFYFLHCWLWACTCLLDYEHEKWKQWWKRAASGVHMAIIDLYDQCRKCI